MHPSRLSVRRTRPYLALVAVLACVDRVTGPTPNAVPSGPPPLRFARVECIVNVRALTVSCPTSRVITANVAAGNAAHGVQVVTGPPAFDGRIFSFDASLESSIAQPLGTADGSTLDPRGIRAFFSIGPTVAQGDGTVDFTDAAGASLVDGIATITAPNQPFYGYSGIIAPGATSSPRRWRFDVNGSVTAFTFSVDIDAAVPHPTGFIDITPAALALRRGRRASLEAVVRTVFGDAIDGALVSWASSTPSVATVDSSGVVTGAGDGTATITAASVIAGVSRTGSAVVTVASASPAATTMSAAPASAVAGDSSIIIVQARTAVGANLAAGGDTVTESADGGTLSTVVDRGDGTYAAVLRSRLAREIHVAGTINGAAIAQQLSVRFVSGPPASMQKIAGDGQSGGPGFVVPVAPTVRVVDANDNPVPGAVVAFAVSSGGGSITGAIAATNDSGIVAVASWTLGSTAGVDTLTATAGNLSVTFIATVVAAPIPAPPPAAPATPAGSNTLTKRAGDNQTAVAGTSLPVSPSVIVLDPSGNPVAGAAITFVVASGGGSVTGATQTSDASGIAAVGSWTIGTTAGANALTASVGGVSVTFSATGIAGPPASITKTAGDGQTAAAGSPVPVAPAIAIKDAHGNAASGVTVTFAVGSGGGSVTGATQTTDAAGAATVGSWTLGTTAGSNNNSLIASAGALSATFTASVSAGPAPPPVLDHFLVEASRGGPIGTQTAGVAFSIRVTAQDASNNTVTGFTGTVNITSSGTLSAGGGTSPAFSAGVLASHDVAISNAGTFTISATRTGGTETGTSNAFTVNAGALHHFLVESAGGGAISAQTAGVAFSIRITAQDASNNTVTSFTGTVDVTSNRTGSAGLTTTAAFAGGVLTSHSVALTQSGSSSTITVTRTGGTETGVSNLFVVNPGAVHHFVVESSSGGPISTQTAGAPFSLRLTAQDQFNNTATGFTGTVTITSTGMLTAGGGTSAAFTAGVLAPQSVTIGNTGTFTITATRTGGTESGTSNAFSVNAGALHHFLVESAGGGVIPTQTAGVAFSIRVTAQDAANNTVTSFTGTVDVTANRTGTAGLATSAAFTAGVLASHSVTLTQSGTGSTITATRTGGAETGTSAPFTVNSAALDHFSVEAQAGGSIPTQTAGVAFTVRITARDQFANTVTTFTGTVDVTSNRTGTSGLTTSAAFTAGALASHSVTITQAGAGATITAKRTGGTETGVSNAFTVNAAALHHFLVEAPGGGSIGTQTAAVPFNIQITAQDQFANTVTAFTGTVEITSTGTLSSGGGTSAAFVAGVLGSHAVTISNTGTFTITATRTGGTETGSSNGFVVNPGPLHHFLVEAAGGGPIPTQTAGISFNVRITAQDAGNNTVTAFTGTVGVTSNRTGSAGLTTSAAFTAGVLAAHAITLTQASAGATITATRTGGTETGISNTFTVNPGAVTHFVVESAAGGPIATQLVNVPFSIRVTAEDQFNNVATQFSGPGSTVDITSTGTLSAGGGTTAAFSSGVLASHSVTFGNTGNFTITATRTGGTESGTSNAFDVVPPPSVTTTSPVAGATDIALNATITINFNRAVSATTSSFTIQCPVGSGTRAYTLTTSPSATYTLTPVSPLPAGEVCTVTAVAAQIADQFGFHPTADFTFTFTTRFHANDDNYPQTVIGNVSINSANIPFSVVTNDTIGAAATVTFAGFGATAGVTENGGTVSITASGVGRGQFIYNPPTGFNGTDHFTYTATQGALSSSATVTVSVSGLIWFIDDNTGSCTTSCDGRLSNPFTTLAAFQAVNDGAGNHPRAGNSVFLYQSGTPYVAPVTLLNNQKLIGQDATVSLATLFGTTPPSGSAPFPTMNSGDATTTTIAGVAGGVTLASGANAFIHGLTIATTGGTALASGATFGTLTFADGTSETADVSINATGGGAMSLTSGAVSGVMANVGSTGGTNGLNFVTLSGSLTINGGALSGSSAQTVLVSSGSASIAYGGTISQVAGNKVVSADANTGGTIDMRGNITCNTACTGVQAQNNTNTVVQFSGSSVSLSTGTSVAVNVSGNTGGSVRFTGGGLSIATTTATAFNIGTGTIVVTGANNTISTTAAAGISMSSATVGAEGVAFLNVASGGSTGNGNNLNFANVTGGAVSIAGGSLSGTATNSVLVTGGSSNITYAGTITSAAAVNVSGYTGTITLSGTSKAITSGANKGVVLANNTGGTIRFTNGGLVLTSTSGNAFEATGGGTVVVSGTGNTLTSTTGTALSLQNTTSGGLAFQSISAAGGANGIFYSNAGTGGLTVTGNGGRCDTGATTCTGGTINGTTGADNTTNGIGIYLNASSNVTLRKMRLAGTHQNFGILGSSMSNVTLDTLLLNGTFGTAGTEATLAFDELSGTALVRGSNMAPASGSMGDNVRVRNTTSITLDRIVFDADTIGFTGNNGMNALYVLARAGTLNATVQNSLLRGGKQKGVILTDTLAGTSDFVFTGNNVQQGTAGITYGNPVGSAFQITTSGAVTTTYTIANNSWSNLVNAANAALAIFAGQTGLGLSGSVSGSITSNSIGSTATANSGSRSISVDLETIGSGTHQAKFTDNSIAEYGDNAFVVNAGGTAAGLSSPRFDLTFARNTIKQPRAAAGVVVGFDMTIGLLTGDAPTICMNFGAGTGNLNDVNASSNVDVPFVIGSTAGSNAFLKLVNYPGGPDPGDATSAGTANTVIRAGILNSTLDGVVDLTGVSQVGNENAAIGRACSLPSP